MVDFGQDLWYGALKSILTEPLSRTLGGIEVVGLENVPIDGPGLVVGNHRTVSDPFLLGAVLPRRIHYVVAAFMGKLPFTSQLASSTGNIVLPVSSGGKSVVLIRKARKLLNKGRLVGVFPEGMDNFQNGSPPGTISRFHSTFARLLVELEWPELPIIPVALTGEEERIVLEFPAALLRVADPFLRVSGDGKIVVPVYRSARITIGKPLQFPEVISAPPDDREGLVDRLVDTVHHAIVELANAQPFEIPQRAKGLSAMGFFDESDA